MYRIKEAISDFRSARLRYVRVGACAGRLLKKCPPIRSWRSYLVCRCAEDLCWRVVTRQ